VTVQGRDPELRDKHIAELISELASETGTLVRQEMALARAELAERMDAVRSEFADAVDLARTETAQKLDQAKADVTRKGKQAGAGIGMFGAAGAGVLLALAALTAALVLFLNRWMPADVAALLAAVAWALIAASAALRGRDKVHEAGGLHPAQYVPTRTIETFKDDLRKAADPNNIPRQTIETVKEDVEWAKTPRRSAER
jgi:hypothetical protein